MLQRVNITDCRYLKFHAASILWIGISTLRKMLVFEATDAIQLQGQDQLLVHQQ